MSTVLPKAHEWVFAEIAVGQTCEIERTFTAFDSDEFARLSGDFSPLHVDAEYTKSTEFGDRVIHGMLLASLFSQLVGMWLPGKHALYLGQDLSFRRPVLVGETVKASAKVISKNAATRTLNLAMEIRNWENKVVVSGTAKVKLRDLEPVSVSVSPVEAQEERKKVAHRVALVTGASRGIGAEIARALAERGAAVVVNYFRSAELADGLVQSIRSKGGEAIAIQADVRQADEVQQMVSTISHRFGRLDWVVNAAIGELQQGSFIELDWKDFQAHLDYQVRSVMHVAQSAYPAMKAAGGGAMVNILSQVTAGQPPARMADYVSAKYALYGLSKALASEWAADNIRVNMVSPGLIETDLTAHYPERVFKLEASRTPLKRIARPSDVAAAVAYLLADESSFVTGTNLFVTGGQVMA